MSFCYDSIVLSAVAIVNTIKMWTWWCDDVLTAYIVSN